MPAPAVRDFLVISLPDLEGTRGPFGISHIAAYDILVDMAGRHRQDDMHAYNGMGPQVRDGGTVPRGMIRGEAPPKVPDVNPYFWAVKLLTTAMGEAVSDFLVKQYNPYLAVFASFVVFAIAIIWQFRVPAYRTWPYWTAVAMVAVFGTMVADALHVGIGIPYKVSVVMFAVSLAVVLTVWYRVEHTLSIHSITTPRREFFYWATVICTFAMGTATGDLTAQTLHLGYFTSGVVFTLAICVPLVAWRLGANPVLTFWVAYILTRPIGASFADYFGMPKTSGGLGIGHGPVSLVTLALVVASIWYLSRTGKDLPTVSANASYGQGPRYENAAVSGPAWDGYGYGPQPGYPARPGNGPTFTPAPEYPPGPGYHQPAPEYPPGPGYYQPGDRPVPGYRPAPGHWPGDDYRPAPGYRSGDGGYRGGPSDQ